MIFYSENNFLNIYIFMVRLEKIKNFSKKMRVKLLIIEAEANTLNKIIE